MRALLICCLLTFSITASVAYGENETAATCDFILQAISKLRSVPQFTWPIKNKEALRGLNVVAFHGNQFDRVVVPAMTTYSYDIHFAQGLAIWSEAPWKLKKARRISRYTLINDPEYHSQDNAAKGWPNFERALGLAQGYTDVGSSQIVIGERVVKADYGIILGLRSDVFEKYPLRLASGNDIRETSRGDPISFSLLELPSGRLPFEDVAAIIFRNQSVEKSFQEALRLKEAEVNEAKRILEQSAQPPSVDNLFDLFKNRPGEFIKRAKTDATIAQIVLSSDQATKEKFSTTHPETWAYFLELFGEGHP